jgi:hypothetical protein
MWKEMTMRTRVFSAAAAVKTPGRVLDVRYEDLVARPLDVGTRILDHVGLPTNRRVRRRLLLANTFSIGKYRQRSNSDIAQVESLIEPELVASGYTTGRG